jgi:hypothetical protein
LAALNVISDSANTMRQLRIARWYKFVPRYADAYRLRAEAYRQKQQLAEANADLETAQRLQAK